MKLVPVRVTETCIWLNPKDNSHTSTYWTSYQPLTQFIIHSFLKHFLHLIFRMTYSPEFPSYFMAIRFLYSSLWHTCSYFFHLKTKQKFTLILFPSLAPTLLLFVAKFLKKSCLHSLCFILLLPFSVKLTKNWLLPNPTPPNLLWQGHQTTSLLLISMVNSQLLTLLHPPEHLT